MKRFDRRTVPGLLLGAALSVWFLSGVDWPALVGVLRAVHLGWIALAVGLVFAELLVRGLRWWMMLRSVDPTLPLSLAVSATVIGAGANVIVPFRGGDLLRPAILSSRRDIPFAVALSSTLLERLLDMAGALGILAAMLFTLPPASETSDVVDTLRNAIAALLVSGVILFGVTVIIASGRARRLVNRMIARIPAAKARRKAAVLHEEVLIGLRSVGSMARLLVCVGITGAVWVCGVLAVEAVLIAFGLADLPIETSLFVVGSINVAISVPQAPGFLGVFQVVVERGLSVWNADLTVAKGVAIVYWAVCFVPVVIGAMFEAWRGGFGMTDPPAEKILDGQSEAV